jgi:hypothetical protein
MTTKDKYNYLALFIFCIGILVIFGWTGFWVLLLTIPWGLISIWLATKIGENTFDRWSND